MSDGNRAGEAGGAGGGAAGAGAAAGGAGAAGAGAAAGAADGGVAGGAGGAAAGEVAGAGAAGAGTSGAGGAAAGAAGADGKGSASGDGKGVAGDWPTDWREKMAGGDAKRLAELQRYTSPQAVDDARRAAAERISKGDLKQPKPEGAEATPEKLAEWRKAQGIPEAPDKYEMPKGLVVGDADKPIVDGFLKTMHEQDATPGEVQRALGWWQAHQEAQREAMLEADSTYRDQNLEILQREMGPEIRRNLKMAEEFLKDTPAGVYDAIGKARGPDGRLLFANAQVLSWFTNMALAKNPQAAVMGMTGPAANAAMETEISGLEKQMGDFNSDYHKGPNRDKLQARYRELITARDKLKG